jgi:tyrosine-protein phosphatase SIW14
VLDEYRNFAEPKIRECDVEYITALDTTLLATLAESRKQLRLPFNFRRFGRTAVFAAFMLIIWICSGTQMSVASEGGSLPLPTA